MTVRIAQISDTHLSVDRPVFNDNFAVIAEALRASRPDIVINTGDLALDGADSEADLALAKSLHDGIDIETRLLAGNHDVGDDPAITKRQPADAARLARWQRLVGPSFWSFDVPGWRILGLDALILGTALDIAEAQAAFLAEAAADLSGRSLAVFLHKPLCDEALGEPTLGSRFLTAERRAALLDALGGARPALFACGHVHQYRDGVIDGARHLWAPATAFLISDPWQPVFGCKTVGYLEHRFHADGTHDHRLVPVRGLAHLDLLHVPEAYGDIRGWGPGGA
jgi:Icc protein